MPHFLATNYPLAPLYFHPCRPGWIYCTQPAPDTKNLLRRAQFLSLAQLKKGLSVIVCLEREKTYSLQTTALAHMKTHVYFQIHTLINVVKYRDYLFSCLCVIIYAVWIISIPIMLLVFTSCIALPANDKVIFHFANHRAK